MFPQVDFNVSSIAGYCPPNFTVDVPDHPTSLRPNGTTEALKARNSTLFCVNGKTGQISQAKCSKAKVHLLLNAPHGSTMFVCWPGRHSSDGFQIDSREKALLALGCMPLDAHPNNVQRAADGSCWVVN